MKQVATMAAILMAAAARTAPKAGGKDFPEIVVISGEEDLKRIAESMKAYAPRSTNEDYWLRDAGSIEHSEAALLVGLKKFRAAGYDRVARRFPRCAELNKKRQPSEKDRGYTGPHCVMRMMDIGVALASAAKTVGFLHIDNRVRQRFGAAARALGLIDTEMVMGVPVSIAGKSIYHDCKVPAEKGH